MKNIFGFILLSSLIFTLQAQSKGLHCGTRGSFWGTLASEIAIPDYFPPENFLARLFLMNPFFSDLASCEEEFEAVHLGKSCELHDKCYRTIGAQKDYCDDRLLENWHFSCEDRYQDRDELSSHCLNACKGVTRFMYDTMRYDDGYFCPSCTAFEKDQAWAKSVTSTR